MARVELSGVGKNWGAVWGVRDVSLPIGDEEFVVLLGPSSGCRKTKTMRMVAGLEEPSEGDIEWTAKPSTTWTRETATKQWHSKAMTFIRT